MWLDIIRERRKELKLTIKCVAERADLTERTTARVFSGETVSPSTDTLKRIAKALDLSLDYILADGNSVVGAKNYVELQGDNETLTAEIERLNSELALVRAESAVLKDKITVLTTENGLLRLKLEHKEEIIALHNYYIKLKSGDQV